MWKDRFQLPASKAPQQLWFCGVCVGQHCWCRTVGGTRPLQKPGENEPGIELDPDVKNEQHSSPVRDVKQFSLQRPTSWKTAGQAPRRQGLEKVWGDDYVAEQKRQVLGSEWRALILSLVEFCAGSCAKMLLSDCLNIGNVFKDMKVKRVNCDNSCTFLCVSLNEKLNLGKLVSLHDHPVWR